MKCKFFEAWIGECGAITLVGKDVCQKHSEMICSVCGNQTYENCSNQIISLICGAPKCNKHGCKACAPG